MERGGGWASTLVGGRLWLGDVRRLLMTNLLAYDGPVWLVTVTAPGVNVLPWDEEVCRVKGLHEHGGPVGCRVVRQEASEWNRTAPRRWSELHRRAYQATVRALGYGPTCLGRVWQLQTRGVLHVHLVLGRGSPLEVAAAWQYVAELRARTPAAGFGKVDAVDRDGKSGRKRVMEGHRAAGYLSGYLGESAQLHGAIGLRERPRRLVWVAPRLTTVTLCTMRRLRRKRLLWRIREGLPVLALAGRLPVWFHDPVEYAAIAGLLAGP